MQRTRLDRYKIKQQMLRCKLEYFTELIDRAGISQTVFYTSLDSHKWRAQTVDALANALQCSPLDLLTVDNAGEYAGTPHSSITEQSSRKCLDLVNEALAQLREAQSTDQ